METGEGSALAQLQGWAVVHAGSSASHLLLAKACLNVAMNKALR